MKKLLGWIDFEIGFWMGLVFLFLFKRDYYSLFMNNFSLVRKEAKNHYLSNTAEQRMKKAVESLEFMKNNPIE